MIHPTGDQKIPPWRQVKKLREQFRFLDAQQVGNGPMLVASKINVRSQLEVSIAMDGGTPKMDGL